MNAQQKARLDRLVDEFDFDDAIRDMASALCHRAFAQDLHQGRSAEAVIASALYAAARLEDRPHDLSEIATVASADRTAIGRSYKDLSRLLDLDTEVVDPAEFVPRFCSALDVSDDLSSLAQQIVDVSVDTASMSGCSPAGIAAGAVYLAGRLVGGDDAPIQADVADVAQVTEVTVRNRYQDQEELLGIEGWRPWSRTSIDESAGLSADGFNEIVNRFEVIEMEPDLFDSRARCCRCGHIGPYRHLLRNHQPQQFGGDRLCFEEHFSAADLADQLEQFEAVDRGVEFEETHLRCIRCGQTGPYNEMLQQHHTRRLGLGGTRICHKGDSLEDPTGTEVAEQVDRFETTDAEFEVIESRSDLDDLRIRCVHCGLEGRYGELARQHETRWYSDDPSCFDRS